ncbi:MAG: RnfABCDGE type electron transport complex subunit D [Gammaproteobacteria bacterium]
MNSATLSVRSPFHLSGGFQFKPLSGDPRYYQIACLAGLLIFGISRLHFDVSLLSVATIVGTALITQIGCSRLVGLYPDPRSALISSLSLCLLLRSNSLWVLALGAVIAISSKFIIRVNNKHVFNPTNFAIAVLLLLLSEYAWVSPAQWGSKPWFAFMMLCAGGMVVHRATRSDVTIAFLLSWVTIVFGRALWLGDPMSIPLRQLQSGALLLFAFFMISDPKTTPDSRSGRILFALLVAVGAGFVQFVLYRTNGLLWSLVLCSTLVPLIDRLLPGGSYQWKSR